jgi:NAD(P)-dependent dehydrogenase (short-subunit alcohol dehydrogenase family)
MNAQDRVAIVTGGSRGIGAGICLALADAGARVAVNYRSHGDDAERVAAQIRQRGGEAIAVPGDVSKSADVGAMVETVAQRL